MPETEIREKANWEKFHIIVMFSHSSFPGYYCWLKITFITFIFVAHYFVPFQLLSSSYLFNDRKVQSTNELLISFPMFSRGCCFRVEMHCQH